MLAATTSLLQSLNTSRGQRQQLISRQCEMTIQTLKSQLMLPLGESGSASGPTEGIKYDTDKDPWHLMPFDALRGIVKVLAFGANKYAPRNWENGMDWSRCYSALLRHLFAWWHREGVDPDTGYSHLWHAGCCVLFLIAYEIRGIGKDDRPNV